MADASRQRYGLVVAAHLARNKLLESAKIPRQVGPPEFIVECCGSDWPFQHDLQRRCDALRFAVETAATLMWICFPWLSKPGNIQIGNREPAEPRPRFRASASGPLVTDFPSYSRRRARIR